MFAYAAVIFIHNLCMQYPKQSATGSPVNSQKYVHTYENWQLIEKIYKSTLMWEMKETTYIHAILHSAEIPLVNSPRLTLVGCLWPVEGAGWTDCNTSCHEESRFSWDIYQ